MRVTHSSPLQEYIIRHFVQETPLLSQVREKGESLVKGMQISPAEGKLLYVLARMIGATRILEIGTFVGYSTLWMASALPEEGEIISLEANATHAAIAREHFMASDSAAQITLREGKALALLAEMQEPLFDMVFIDAAKGEYWDYLHYCEPMLRTGGLMVLDNSLLFGHMQGEPLKRASQSACNAVAACNARLGDSAYYDGILLPTEEGLTIGVKK